MIVAENILNALERDLEEKREELQGAEVLFSDASEKLTRLCQAGLYEEAAAWAPKVRELALELVVATESWIASMHRLKHAVGA